MAIGSCDALLISKLAWAEADRIETHQTPSTVRGSSNRLASRRDHAEHRSVIPEFVNRNLLVLFICQMIFVGGAVLVTTVGGLVGHALASRPSLATLPVALMVIGTASATIPASLVMQRVGRRLGFFLAATIAATGGGTFVFALAEQSFVLFCAGAGLVGASMGFSQQFRFAAAESVSIDRVSHAVSFILLGSIAGGFIGPELVARSAEADAEAPYALAFELLIALYAIAGILLLGLERTDSAESEESAGETPRPIPEIITQPVFLTAVLASVVGQGIMTYVMTATPISMSVEHEFPVRLTSEVIRAHVIAMYLPSLVTPFLISRLGLRIMMAIGATAMAVTIGIGLAGHHLMHYWFALVLLGIGWNFLFVSATSQLVASYRPSERYRAQAINDFSVFGMSAAASLMAGVVLFELGWTTLLLSTVPVLLLLLFAILWERRRTGSAPVGSRASTTAAPSTSRDHGNE